MREPNHNQLWLIPVGIFLIATGIGGDFLLHYLNSWDWNNWAVWPVLLCYTFGLLFAVAGGVNWAQRGNPRIVIGVGMLIVLTVALTGSRIPFDPDSWTMAIACVYFVAGLIAVVFLIFGIGRLREAKS
jgi:hypothetical protein